MLAYIYGKIDGAEYAYLSSDNSFFEDRDRRAQLNHLHQRDATAVHGELSGGRYRHFLMTTSNLSDAREISRLYFQTSGMDRSQLSFFVRGYVSESRKEDEKAAVRGLPRLIRTRFPELRSGVEEGREMRSSFSPEELPEEPGLERRDFPGKEFLKRAVDALLPDGERGGKKLYVRLASTGEQAMRDSRSFLSRLYGALPYELRWRNGFFTGYTAGIKGNYDNALPAGIQVFLMDADSDLPRMRSDRYSEYIDLSEPEETYQSGDKTVDALLEFLVSDHEREKERFFLRFSDGSIDPAGSLQDKRVYAVLLKNSPAETLLNVVRSRDALLRLDERATQGQVGISTLLKLVEKDFEQSGEEEREKFYQKLGRKLRSIQEEDCARIVGEKPRRQELEGLKAIRAYPTDSRDPYLKNIALVLNEELREFQEKKEALYRANREAQEKAGREIIRTRLGATGSGEALHTALTDLLEELKDSEKYYLCDELLTEEGNWNTFLWETLCSRTEADIQAGRRSYTELLGEMNTLEETLKREGLSANGNTAQRWEQLHEQAGRLAELEKEPLGLSGIEAFCLRLEGMELSKRVGGGLLQRKLEQLQAIDLRELLEWPESCNAAAEKYALQLPERWNIPEPWMLLCEGSELGKVCTELEKLAAHGLLSSRFRVREYDVEAEAADILKLLETAKSLSAADNKEKDALLAALEKDPSLEKWFSVLFRDNTDYLLLLLREETLRGRVLRELEDRLPLPPEFWMKLPLKDYPLETVETLFGLQMKEFQKDPTRTERQLNAVLWKYSIAGLSMERMRRAEPKNGKGAVDRMLELPPLPKITPAGEEEDGGATERLSPWLMALVALGAALALWLLKAPTLVLGGFAAGALLLSALAGLFTRKDGEEQDRNEKLCALMLLLHTVADAVLVLLDLFFKK